MIVKRKNKMYTSKREMIYGYGYVDTLKDIGSYIAQNKDLIAKPMLGAVGQVGAIALSELGKAIIKKSIAGKKQDEMGKQLSADTKQKLLQMTGAGIKKF